MPRIYGPQPKPSPAETIKMFRTVSDKLISQFLEVDIKEVKQARLKLKQNAEIN